MVVCDLLKEQEEFREKETGERESEFGRREIGVWELVHR